MYNIIIFNQFVDFMVKYREVFGIIASSLVLLSFVMKNIKIIRFISLLSAVFFVIYGILVKAYSVWIMNAILIIIQAVYLYLIISKEKKDRFSVNTGEAIPVSEENN